MRVYFSNLGCKLNQAETDHLQRRFLAAGHLLAASLEEADLHVVNSCHVTHLAARDSRKAARRGGRLRAGLKTVLTGCYATGQAAEAAALEGIDLVVPNHRKAELLEEVHRAFPEAVPGGDPIPVPYVPIDVGRARGLVKVEDGCNMRCSFCIIPFLRGRQVSRPVEEVVREVRQLAALGYREVVVTGVQISEYEDDGRRLYDLVSVLLDEVEGPRLRLTSIAPWRFDDRLLSLFQHPRLCRHLHMSLQSGCSATLRRMRRPYGAADYAELVAKVRQAIPGVAVTTDVIVGFPGETEEEFTTSLDFVERMAFARPHIFTFSPRAGTHAATLPDSVHPAEKKRRVHALRRVAERSERAFWRDHLGRSLEVVWEERRHGLWRGLTDNYIRVLCGDDTPQLAGQLGTAILDRLDEHGVRVRPQAA